MNDRIAQLQQLLLKEPDDAFLNYALALELAKNNETQKAITTVENILQKNANYLPAYYQLGKFYEQIGKKAKAADSYSKGAVIAQQQNNQKTWKELKEAFSAL